MSCTNIFQMQFNCINYSIQSALLCIRNICLFSFTCRALIVNTQIKFNFIGLLLNPLKSFTDKGKHHELRSTAILIRFETPCTKNNENSKGTLACTLTCTLTTIKAKQSDRIKTDHLQLYSEKIHFSTQWNLIIKNPFLSIDSSIFVWTKPV